MLPEYYLGGIESRDTIARERGEKINNCCSDECMEIVALPEEEQKALRRGKVVSNKIFRKGRSEKLKFKK